ncbi:hypothetical protein PIB30_104119 [Stylosanthes scabra]|uniref:Uncharacterized protein n=1 Tax=Stylosanthes scabra TaxID=79078 RepID=A0ABU6ZWR4_9FABA|nr:hypothetical protein [Stylosanthes scabra]
MGESLHTGGSTTYEATRDRMTVELGRTPTHSEVFERSHTRKEDQLWVDKRSADVNEAFLAELKRLQAERQALMEAGCPEPPPIDEVALWTRFAGGRKRGRIYGMGVEVFDLRKAYVDMYSLLTQMRSGGSSSAPLPDFPPPPPPPPPPQTDAPGTGPGTGSPDADNDPDYV